MLIINGYKIDIKDITFENNQAVVEGASLVI